MPLNYRYTFLVAAALLLNSCAKPSPESESLFNGTDLSGWKGDPSFWSVRDESITGQTSASNPTDSNTFLIWEGGTPANFELALRFRLTGENDRNWGNSGIQYRSRRIGSTGYAIGGYQADIDSNGKYTGMLYEERGRGLIMEPGQKIRIAPQPTVPQSRAPVEILATPSSKEQILEAYQIGDWNEFKIVADGNHMRHYLNGILTADVRDDDPNAAATQGLIALQLHQGEPMTIQFKDIQLVTLP